MSASGYKHHVLSVLVENKAGVLARVAQLFARRGFNIYSLAVAPTDDERFSRITIVVDVESAPLEQVVKQLNKLIDVIKVVDHEGGAFVGRELAMLKVRTGAVETDCMAATTAEESIPPDSSAPSGTSATRRRWWGRSSASAPATRIGSAPAPPA